MGVPRKELTAEQVRAILRYEPDTGLIYWISGGRWNRLAGTVAGTRHPNGYTRIQLLKQLHYAHRLAWLYMTGAWPADEIDHVDNNPGNDRWSNLRPATSHQNKGNARRPRDNTSGVKGVSFDTRSGRWEAYTTRNSKKKSIGLFDNLEDAAEARRQEGERYFGEFAREG